MSHDDRMRFRCGFMLVLKIKFRSAVHLSGAALLHGSQMMPLTSSHAVWNVLDYSYSLFFCFCLSLYDLLSVQCYFINR